MCTCTEDVVTGTYLLEIFCANIKSNTQVHNIMIISTKKLQFLKYWLRLLKSFVNLILPDITSLPFA